MFLIRNFWEIEKPSSTEDETESTSYPGSEVETVVPFQSKDNLIPELESPLQNLELPNFELKSEIRKLQFEVERCHTTIRNQELNHQSVINQLKRENGTANNDRLELEKELIASKSRVDQLEFEIKRLERVKMKFQSDFEERKAKCESLENQYHKLVKCRDLKL